MPKYSSRVNGSGGAQTKKAGKPPTRKKPAIKSGGDLAGGASLGGALNSAAVRPSEMKKLKAEIIISDRANNITPDTTATSGGSLVGDLLNVGKVFAGGDLGVGGGEAVGGDLGVGGGEAVGGGIIEDVQGVAKKVVSAAKEVKSVVKKAKNPAELANSLQGVVGKLSHNGMIQVLQHMSPQQFHILQGVAGSHLPNFNGHPLSGVARKVLGGSFSHPRNISKMATRDIVRAISPQQLASAMHMEMMDAQKGMDVGGGLLDSVKHTFNRGLDGLKSGVAAGTRLGSVLHGALSTGIQVGRVFSPVVETLFPGAGQLIDTGISSAEALKAGLEVGVKAGEALSEGLEGISPIDTSDKPVAGQPFTAPISTTPRLGPSEEEPVSAPPSFAPPAPPSFEDVSQEFPGLSQQELINMGLLSQ